MDPSEEQKLRNALHCGISAVDIWKLIGDDHKVKNPATLTKVSS